MLTDSAVILLYAGLLGAGDFLSLLTMAVLPLLNGLLILPMAGLASACGSRKLVLRANAFALAGYLLTAAAAFADDAAVPLMLGGILLFSICQTGFVAGWFPMLDTFLLPERRTLFLGRMRFFHQISAVAFLGILGAVIGKTPAVGTLQLALLAGVLVFAGRLWFISRIPHFPEPERVRAPLRAGLRAATKNLPLVLFSLYTFLLNLAMFAVVPVMLLYLKNVQDTPGDWLVLISAAAFAGMPAGYLPAHWLDRKLGRKNMFRLLHAVVILDLAALLLVSASGASGAVCVALLLALCNGCIAANSVVAGAMMMELAAMGNKAVAMAFWGVFYYGGSGVARLGASLLIASGVLAANWSIGGQTMSSSHSVLLIGVSIALFAGIILLLPGSFFRSSGPAPGGRN